jgi:Na+-driven multidrug efflux pump
MGLLPSGSYSYASGDFGRTGRLIFHAWWLMGALAISISVTMDAFPRQIARIFSHEKLFVERFKKCGITYWSTTTFVAWQMLGTCIQQVVNRPIAALICTIITQLIFFPLVGTILFFTDKHNPVRLFAAPLFNDPSAFVVTVMFVGPCLWMLRRKYKAGKSSEVPLLASVETNDGPRYD